MRASPLPHPRSVPRKYPSAFAAYGIIARTEGVAGLWTGVGPNIGRNAIINAAELASYDQVKQSLLATGHFQDNTLTHLLSGLGAGFVAVCVGSPVDVVKSRVMGDKVVRSVGRAGRRAAGRPGAEALGRVGTTRILSSGR